MTEVDSHYLKIVPSESICGLFLDRSCSCSMHFYLYSESMRKKVVEFKDILLKSNGDANLKGLHQGQVSPIPTGVNKMIVSAPYVFVDCPSLLFTQDLGFTPLGLLHPVTGRVHRGSA
jgi:hypothetical protein